MRELFDARLNIDDTPMSQAALVEAVKTHSLGQISHTLYDVGGEYRRNM